jgi:hypothetical protein
MQELLTSVLSADYEFQDLDLKHDAAFSRHNRLEKSLPPGPDRLSKR